MGPNRQRQQQRTGSKSARPRLSVYFQAAGGLIVFTSFIIQNYVEFAWTSQHQYQNLVQNMIMTEEIKYYQWAIVAIEEHSKPPPPSQLLKDALFKSIQHNANIFTWADARLLPNARDQIAAISSKNDLVEKAHKAYVSNDLPGLEKIANNLTARIDENGPAMIDAWSKKYEEVRENEDQNRKYYLAAYLIGSLLFGIGFLLKNFRELL